MKANVKPIAPMDIADIRRLLPHRYPLLLVDRVLEGEPGHYLRAVKNVTANEHFFRHAVPWGIPMPEMYILEALSQCCGLLAFQSGGSSGSGRIGYLAGIRNAYFQRDVWPGDQLCMHVAIDRVRRHIWRFSTCAQVDGETVVAADIRCSLAL